MNRRVVLTVVAQTVLGMGLLFFGWGFDDVAGFFRHPARAGLMVVALASLIYIFAARVDLQMFRRGTRPVGRQRLGLLLVFAVGLVFAFFLPYADRRGLLTFDTPVSDLLRYVGLGLYAAGNIISFLALQALGRQYSGLVTLQDDHQLVTSGIYGVIRHPIYLRALMVSLGLPLLFRSWLWLLTLPLACLFVAMRIGREEQLLLGHFGVEYIAYCQRTHRLIPFVY